MNQGGTPEAQRAPIIEPAEVPTTYSAAAGSQPVSLGERVEPAGEPRAALNSPGAENEPNPHSSHPRFTFATNVTRARRFPANSKDAPPEVRAEARGFGSIADQRRRHGRARWGQAVETLDLGVHAAVAELVDARGSGPRVRKDVGVRILSAAPLNPGFSSGKSGCPLLSSPAYPPLSSRGLGRRILSPETRVRIPVAVPHRLQGLSSVAVSGEGPNCSPLQPRRTLAANRCSSSLPHSHHRSRSSPRGSEYQPAWLWLVSGVGLIMCPASAPASWGRWAC